MSLENLNKKKLSLILVKVEKTEIKVDVLAGSDLGSRPGEPQISEGESLKTTAEYFYINPIFLLVLFSKTLYDQYDRWGIEKFLFMLGVCFGNSPALPLSRPQRSPAQGCIPQTAD